MRLLSVVASAIVVVINTASVLAQPADGVYRIVAKHSGKVLDVAGGPGAVADGVHVQQYTDFGNGNQKWLLVHLGGGLHKILALHSGKALDVQGAATTNGAQVQQYTYTGGSNQQWKLIIAEAGHFRVEAAHSGKVLDVRGGPGATGDGARVQQYDYTGGDNQKWRLEAVSNAVSGLYNGPTGFDRGMQATTYCGNSPESWVRGSVQLDQNSGRVSMTMELETDSTAAGPKGKLVALLKDSSGREIARAETEEALTGGKAPGAAARRRRTGEAYVPVSVARQTAYINLEAQCTGSHFRVYDITLDTITDLVKVITAVAGGGG